MSDLLSDLKKPLDISDVDFRVQSINNGGYATVLAYKDARVDMNRLDSVCGVNWQKDFKLIDGNLYCGVGIKVENEWNWRWDVGTESNTEKEKGQASDAFKRACFNWGIGRELYNYPLIQVKLLTNEFKVENGKPKSTFDLKLKEWKWTVDVENGDVTFLQAIDNNGKIRFTFKKGTSSKSQLQTAIEDMGKVSTIEELKTVWSSNKDLQTDNTFISAKDKRKDELSNGQQ